MANLSQIEVTIQTADRDGAGTDGDIYLGICGREFHCDTSANDFERNSGRTYKFGEVSNVLNAAENDPRKPQLQFEDAALFPAYIRFDQGSGSSWCLALAQVQLNGVVTHEFLPGDRNAIWLGSRAGLCQHLRRHNDAGSGARGSSGAAASR